MTKPTCPSPHDVQLQPFNTFGIAARARRYLRVTDPAQLAAVAADPALAALPRLVLGGGSNLLFTRDEIDALVLHMASRARKSSAKRTMPSWCAPAPAKTGTVSSNGPLGQGLGGLENMSLIPGTVGASPIQNIGAYGPRSRTVFHR
jgi:UDP-N-acetylmuramate dehydrogenase